MFPGSQPITIVSTCDTILQLGKKALSTGDENDIFPFPSTQLNDLWENLTEKCNLPFNYAPLASNCQYIILRSITPSNIKPNYFMQAVPEKD